MASPTPTPDLILRISLVRDESDMRELSPSIWRSFKVSSAVNLELLHDKVLSAVMGWERNYHTYYFRKAPKKSCSSCDVENGGEDTNPDVTTELKMRQKMVDSSEGGRLGVMLSGDEYRGSTSKQNCIHYVQTNTAATDAMWVNKFADEGSIRKPENYTIGDLLKDVGDRCIYNYDLGDCFYHCLEVEAVVPAEESSGRAEILDGAMRCPGEDGDGSAAHQTQILDLLLKVREDPLDDAAARRLARACFEKRGSLNVQGPFRPEEFDVSERRAALSAALGSRNSTRDATKTFSNGKTLGMARVGQRHVEYKKEDDRFDHLGGYMTMSETLNVKPDPKDQTLCNNCGSPHNLKGCSRCHSAFYCSRECQREHWGAGHKKRCKKEKIAYEKYCFEVENNAPDPNRFNHDGGFIPMKKYVPGKLRFRVGDFVECWVEKGYATGRIVKLNYREPGWAPDSPTAPYQVKLDRESANRLGIPFQRALIYSDWDDDLKIRKVPHKKAGGKRGKKAGKKSRGK